MEKVLVTFPGRAGDLLWALPTIRAISQSLGHPVDLQIAGEFSALVPLLVEQPYLRAVWADPRWAMIPADGWWVAPRLPEDHDRVIHLGYRRWPELPLPLEVYDRAQREGLALPPLDLETPWITAAPWPLSQTRVVVGWSECWVELKAGLLELLHLRRDLCDEDGTPIRFTTLAAPGSRWETEAGAVGMGWVEAARRIAAADLFLGDCSGLHVLACALGKPCVLVEPMVERHNPIFWPYGMDGRAKIVRGNDGQPTTDARHVADVLREALR